MEPSRDSSPEVDIPNTPVAEDGTQHIEVSALFNSIGDGAIMTDEFGRIERINPAALVILGFEEKELLGKWFPRVIVSINDKDSPTALIDRPISRAFLTGKSVTEKMTYRRKDGRSVPVSITVSPMMVDEKPIGAIEVFRDISLEYEIDRMKSEFISLASHQLRTPLSAIKTYSHMLIDGFMGQVEPAQEKAIRTIISASNRMNELISTLLNITRIESGSIAISPKQISVCQLAEDIYTESLLVAKEKALALTLHVPKTEEFVQTDSLICKEIMTNLVTNAIKYTPEKGSVMINVKGRRHTVVFSVTDTGLGIPESSHDQIFSKFFRAPNVVKQETTGTGLGLYLVKGLAEVLGGKVWFTSAENEGSTFFFALPRNAPSGTTKGTVT